MGIWEFGNRAAVNIFVQILFVKKRVKISFWSCDTAPAMGPMRWSETTRVVPPHSHSHSVTRPYVIKTLMKINNGQKIEPFFTEYTIM